ncbi:hypothetical protein BC830DRAFT_804814 [Chytriomyces sp. MP71]|nr:hypothetical protein BC830DRAFT_804814 [Chytriomyces sp. MP71]
MRISLFLIVSTHRSMFVSSQVKKGGFKFKPKGPSSASQLSQSTQPDVQNSEPSSATSTANSTQQQQQQQQLQLQLQPLQQQQKRPSPSEENSHVAVAMVESVAKRVHFENEAETTTSPSSTAVPSAAPSQISQITHVPAHRSPRLPSRPSLRSPALNASSALASGSQQLSDMETDENFSLGEPQFAVPAPIVRPTAPPRIISASSRLAASGTAATASDSANRPGISIARPGSAQNRPSPSNTGIPRIISAPAPSSNTPNKSTPRAPSHSPTPSDTGSQAAVTGGARPLKDITISSEEDLRRLSLDQLMSLKSDFLKPSRRAAMEAELKRLGGRSRRGSDADSVEGRRSSRAGSVDLGSMRGAIGARTWTGLGGGGPSGTQGGRRASPPQSEVGGRAASVRSIGAGSASVRGSGGGTRSGAGGGGGAGVGPRIQIVDGQIVVDESSLVVTAVPAAQQEDEDREDMEVVDESAGSVHITSASFRTGKIRGNRWNAAETDEFFRALSYFGTDFQMILLLFPHLTRRHLKAKFNTEEREHPNRVNNALRNRIVPPEDVVEKMKEAFARIQGEGRSERTQNELPEGASARRATAERTNKGQKLTLQLDLPLPLLCPLQRVLVVLFPQTRRPHPKAPPPLPLPASSPAPTSSATSCAATCSSPKKRQPLSPNPATAAYGPTLPWTRVWAPAPPCSPPEPSPHHPSANARGVLPKAQRGARVPGGPCLLSARVVPYACRQDPGMRRRKQGGGLWWEVGAGEVLLRASSQP